jgi:hypothetical protein
MASRYKRSAVSSSVSRPRTRQGANRPVRARWLGQLRQAAKPRSSKFDLAQARGGLDEFWQHPHSWVGIDVVRGHLARCCRGLVVTWRPRDSGRVAPSPRSRASCCAARTTSSASSATPRSAPQPDQLRGALRPLTLMLCGRLPKSSCRPGHAPAAPDRPSGRAHFGTTRFTISSPTRPGPRTKIRSGARAQPSTITALAHGPPNLACAGAEGQIRSVAFASIEVCPLAGRPQRLRRRSR